jgi:hypothetical protein
MIRKVKSKKFSKSKVKAKVKATKLPPRKDQYSWLAELKQIKYFDPDQKTKTVKFKKSDPWSLLWNPITNELLGIKNSLCKDVELKGKNILNLPAMKSFIAFQDHPSLEDYDFSKNFISTLKQPIKWEFLGKGKQIDYWSEKFNLNDFWLYYHKFGEYDQNMPIVKDHKVKIYYDPLNKLIKIAGGKLTVTERGIIN